MGQMTYSPLSIEAEPHVVNTVGYVDPMKFMQPHGVWATDTHLYITDYTNIRPGRLLIYDTLKPGPEDEPRIVDRISGNDCETFYAPSSVVVCNDRCYLADFGNKRLMIFDSPLPENGDTPIVIDFVDAEPSKLNSANGLFITSDRLYMTDTFEHRLIVWDTPVPEDNQPAHIFSRMGGGIEPDTLKNLRSVLVVNGRCYLDDFDNDRVFIFDSELPKDGDVPIVISNIGGGIEPDTFNGPIDIAATDTHLLVTDFNNDRILIYDTLELVDGMAPCGMIDCASRGNQIRPDCLRKPRDLFISDKYIYVTGFYTDRLLIFDRKDVLGDGA